MPLWRCGFSKCPHRRQCRRPGYQNVPANCPMPRCVSQSPQRRNLRHHRVRQSRPHRSSQHRQCPQKAALSSICPNRCVRNALMMLGSFHVMTVRHRMWDRGRGAAANLLGNIHGRCLQRFHYQSVTARGSAHRLRLLLRRPSHRRRRRPV